MFISLGMYVACGASGNMKSFLSKDRIQNIAVKIDDGTGMDF